MCVLEYWMSIGVIEREKLTSILIKDVVDSIIEWRTNKAEGGRTCERAMTSSSGFGIFQSRKRNEAG